MDAMSSDGLVFADLASPLPLDEFREKVRDPEFMEKMKLNLERHNCPRSCIRLPDDAES